ncbi:hypothetical protein [Duganella hordei]|jgi:hypothetical protein|uniref:hypothetical protein n=1 Tax=Duganella hordei TaxID=2865934 RepID=UPI0030E871D7
MSCSAFTVYDPDTRPTANPKRASLTLNLNSGAVLRKYRKHVIAGGKSSNAVDHLAVVPGQIASASAILDYQLREKLGELIHQLALPVTSVNGAQESGAISGATAASAIAFFKALPNSKLLPKVAPEGEGGLTAIWQTGNAPLILVIEDWRFHMVKSATTAAAEYFDGLLFDGEKIPQEVIEAIPQY